MDADIFVNNTHFMDIIYENIISVEKLFWILLYADSFFIIWTFIIMYGYQKNICFTVVTNLHAIKLYRKSILNERWAFQEYLNNVKLFKKNVKYHSLQAFNVSYH